MHFGMVGSGMAALALSSHMQSSSVSASINFFWKDTTDRTPETELLSNINSRVLSDRSIWVVTVHNTCRSRRRFEHVREYSQID
jgi:hypothetical protein